MNTLEVIKKRKCVRNYNDTPVESEKVKAVVEAGYMAAGSTMAGKRYFNVITTPELLKKLSDTTKAVMQNSGNEFLMKSASNPNYSPIYNAPVAVVISTDKNDDPTNASMLTANAACAGENMLIAAEELGLRSCYTASPTLAFMDQSMGEAINLPEGALPQAVILFGYSEDDTPHAERPENPEEIIYA